MPRMIAVGLCLALLSPDLPLANFLGNTYGDWTKTGTAFNPGPASGDLLTKLEIQNSGPKGVISSEIEGDQPTGTLTSPKFKIQRDFLAFRIGGGSYDGQTCLNLLVRGKVVRTTTGRRSDRLTPASWDIKPWRGQEAQLQVVDLASGDWGHINVDRIMQTGQPERKPLVKAPLYQELLRPQYHFTARQWTVDKVEPGQREEGWINDLNGLIYYEGEYHLFAQRWAKCWLHAVSKDLVHWTELQPAFWEESEGSGSQSGTCVIDYDNTSGLATDPKNPAMVAFWSRFDNVSQCLCYSLDRGRTWTRYSGNPFMARPERDPKVFWYAPGKHWVMMLYGDGQYHILTSPDLLHWKDEKHPLADSFECPDFFELPIDGDQNRKKWVLIQGNGQYSIGTFNGTEFKEETPRLPCDVGPNFYATQSWHNTDTGDGRRIQTAWMRSETFPDMPFNQQISFPCELKLKDTPKGLRILREPIAEIAKLQDGHQDWKDKTLAAGETLPLETKGQTFRIQAEVSIPAGAELTFNIRGIPVTLTSTTLANGHDPASSISEVKTVEILVDRLSIETYVNHGEISSTRFMLPKEEGISLQSQGGEVKIHALTVHKLKSIWPKEK